MAFATTDDVVARLGRALTEPEEALSEYVIDEVAGLIADACGKDAEWASALSPVPAVCKNLCVERAIQIGSNPNNLASESEQLGAHQHSRTFPRSLDGGIFLTDAEERRVRRAVFGNTSGSAVMRSVVDDLYGS